MPETATKMQPQSQIQMIDLDHLVPSPFNARKHFDRPALAELAASIRSEGIQQPLIVRPKPGGKDYEIIAGERRYRAAEIAELKSAPCVVRDVDEPEARRIQIVENLQREDITPLEESQAFQDLLKAKGDHIVDISESASVADGNGGYKLDKFAKPSHTVEALAKELGKSKEYVYGRLKLLKLGKVARKSLEQGHITAGHAVELVPLDEPKQERAIVWLESESSGEATDVSVMQLRDEIRYSINPPPKPKPSAAAIAREKRFRAQNEKRNAEWKKQEAARQRQSERDLVIRDRMIRDLWNRLNHKAVDTDKLLGVIVADFVQHSDDLGAAQLVSAGKPLSEDYVHVDRKAFDRLGATAQLALCVLAIVISREGYHEKENAALYKWAGIDRAKVVKQIAIEKKAAANIGKVVGTAVVDAVKKHGVQTSAKPAASGKGKAKHVAKGAKSRAASKRRKK
jgi:ParB family chromosome partitioning protein